MLSVIALILVLLVALTVVAVMSKGFKNWDSFKEAVPKIEKPAEKETEKTTEKEEQKKDDATSTEQTGENTSSERESESGSGSNGNQATEAETSVASLNAGKVFATAISDDEVEFTMYADPDNKYFQIMDEEFISLFLEGDFWVPNFVVSVDGEIKKLYSFIERTDNYIVYGFSDTGNANLCDIGLFFVDDIYEDLENVLPFDYYPYFDYHEKIAQSAVVFCGKGFEKVVCRVGRADGGMNPDSYLSEIDETCFAQISLMPLFCAPGGFDDEYDTLPAFSSYFDSNCIVEDISNYGYEPLSPYFFAYNTEVDGNLTYSYDIRLPHDSRIIINQEKVFSLFNSDFLYEFGGFGYLSGVNTQSGELISGEDSFRCRLFVSDNKKYFTFYWNENQDVYGRLVEVYENEEDCIASQTDSSVYPVNAYVEICNDSNESVTLYFTRPVISFDKNEDAFNNAYYNQERFMAIYQLCKNYSEENE